MKALQRRAGRRSKDGAMVDMNLVSLIDVFTILIFFLLAHSLDVQTLSPPAGVQLPQARTEQAPRDGIELAVSGQTVLLQGRAVATLSDAGLAALGPALAAQAALRPGERTPLVLVADRELPYHWLRALMRSAAGAGLDEVSFAVRRQEGA
jgi:biopolymer transport protein TolR